MATTLQHAAANAAAEASDPLHLARMSKALEAASSAVLVSSGALPIEDAVQVRGADFNAGPLDLHSLMQSYLTTGFQATSLGLAVQQINQMIALRAQPLSAEAIAAPNLNPVGRRKVNCTIFLGYTSNMMSSGLRETIRFLAQHDLVDCIVTTAGGVEEDLIKCLAPTFLGDFALVGKHLRERGMNRIGDLLVPNNNYCLFQDWLTPILDQMLAEQKQGQLWTPSKIIARLGKEINNPDSVYYWCYKNNIPVFSPALTDSSIGDMLYFHSYKHSRLVIDIMQDLCWVNEQAIHAINTGMIILGGGLIKHHICNANLMRNGADFSVFVNTAQEFDGSDSGARPDEAVSWGKIKHSAKPIKVFGDATIIFPLIVAETFARALLADKSEAPNQPSP